MTIWPFAGAKVLLFRETAKQFAFFDRKKFFPFWRCDGDEWVTNAKLNFSRAKLNFSGAELNFRNVRLNSPVAVALSQALDRISGFAKLVDNSLLACQVTGSKDKERRLFLDGFDDDGHPLHVAQTCFAKNETLVAKNETLVTKNETVTIQRNSPSDF